MADASPTFPWASLLQAASPSSDSVTSGPLANASSGSLSLMSPASTPTTHSLTPTPGIQFDSHSYFDFFSSPSPAKSLPAEMTHNSNEVSALRLLRDASHELLLRSGNASYKHLVIKVMDLEQKLSTAEKELIAMKAVQQYIVGSGVKNEPQDGLDLTASFVANKNMFRGTSLSPGVFSLPNSTHLVPLDQADFPDIRYWKKDVWTATGNENADLAVPSLPSEPKRRGKRTGEGINITMRFLENKHGITITETRLKDILQTARDAWFELSSRNAAAKTWGNTTLEAKQYFYLQMSTYYEEFRYCDNNWKADHLATHRYPSWMQTQKSKDVSIKQEALEALPSTSASALQTSAGPSHKRPSPASIDANRSAVKKLKNGRKQGCLADGELVGGSERSEIDDPFNDIEFSPSILLPSSKPHLSESRPKEMGKDTGSSPQLAATQHAVAPVQPSISSRIDFSNAAQDTTISRMDTLSAATNTASAAINIRSVATDISSAATDTPSTAANTANAAINTSSVAIDTSSVATDTSNVAIDTSSAAPATSSAAPCTSNPVTGILSATTDATSDVATDAISNAAPKTLSAPSETSSAVPATSKLATTMPSMATGAATHPSIATSHILSMVPDSLVLTMDTSTVATDMAPREGMPIPSPCTVLSDGMKTKKGGRRGMHHKNDGTAYSLCAKEWSQQAGNEEKTKVEFEKYWKQLDEAERQKFCDREKIQSSMWRRSKTVLGMTGSGWTRANQLDGLDGATVQGKASATGRDA